MVRCGRMLPYPVIKAMVKGAQRLLSLVQLQEPQQAAHPERLPRRHVLLQAHQSSEPRPRPAGLQQDRKDGFTHDSLGLIHPREVPEGFDFLNLGHAGWCHPCSEEDRSTASFLDLYEEALAECITMLRTLFAVLCGQESPDAAAAAVGEASLDTGRENCIPVHGRPLPLREILDDIYREVEREVANEPPETSAGAEPTYR